MSAMSYEGSLWASSMGYQNCLFQFYYKITKNEESSGSSLRGQFSRQSFSWQHCSLGKSSNGSCWDLSAWPASGERWAEDLPANSLPDTIANWYYLLFKIQYQQSCPHHCEQAEQPTSTSFPTLLAIEKKGSLPWCHTRSGCKTATIHFHAAYKFDCLWLIISLTCTSRSDYCSGGWLNKRQQQWVWSVGSLLTFFGVFISAWAKTTVREPAKFRFLLWSWANSTSLSLPPPPILPLSFLVKIVLV